MHREQLQSQEISVASQLEEYVTWGTGCPPHIVATQQKIAVQVSHRIPFDPFTPFPQPLGIITLPFFPPLPFRGGLSQSRDQCWEDWQLLQREG